MNSAPETPRDGAGRHDGGGWHAPTDLVRRYVDGDQAIPADELWSLEVHLESCQRCRGLLAGLTAERAPADAALIDRVWSRVEPETTGHRPAPQRRRMPLWLATWATPAMTPWLGMVILVIGMAMFADLATQVETTARHSWVALLAPLMPVLMVAASWSRGLDPAYEVVTGTARAGLRLVLRRTFVVLLIVIPVLALAGWVSGTSPAVWLLPAFAFTALTLAAGSVFGVGRSAAAVGTLWSAGVVIPSWAATTQVLIVLEPVSLPAWAAVLVVCSALVVARSGAFTQLDRAW